MPHLACDAVIAQLELDLYEARALATPETGDILMARKDLPETGTTWVVKRSHDTEGYHHEWATTSTAIKSDESLDDGPVVFGVTWACNCGAMKRVTYLTQEPSRAWCLKQREPSE